MNLIRLAKLFGRIIYKLCISSILAILFLSIVIYFYKYAISKSNTNKVTNEVYYPNQFCSNMEEGFAWFYFDKNGYNNSYQVKKDRIDVLLLGSSQLEAIQVKSNENICYLLNEIKPEYYFYNIGVSGHYLPIIINNLSYAYDYFKPTKYIIIEIGRIKMELSEMQSVLNGSMVRKVRKNNEIDFYIKKYIPLFSALRFKVIQHARLWKNNSSAIFKKSNLTSLFSYNVNNNSKNKINDNQLIEKNEYKETLNQILALARKYIPDDISIIIFYHPYYFVQPDGSLINTTDKCYYDIFENACKNNDIVFIDTDSDFIELYKTKHILPYGFINTKICSGHLNKYGHKAIAKRLAKEICDLEGRNTND